MKKLENLKERRMLRGLTQRQLAEKIGTKQSNISDYERLKVAPMPHVVKRIAKALRCAAGAL